MFIIKSNRAADGSCILVCFFGVLSLFLYLLGAFRQKTASGGTDMVSDRAGDILLKILPLCDILFEKETVLSWEIRS